MLKRIEYHICDRCGKEIKNKRDFIANIFGRPRLSVLFFRETFERQATRYNEDGGSEITFEHLCSDTQIELCKECTKEFRKFMCDKGAKECS